jgi:poly-gamma-glutamate capsule biosynthesis protein CapA/YwtB (metallophosphatase superfamily)
LHISLVVVLGVAAVVAGCTSSGSGAGPAGRPSRSAGRAGAVAGANPATRDAVSHRAKGVFTMSFAGDVHFAGRVGERLAANPRTVFGSAAAGLRRADLTMVNLETAITTGGQQQNKEFTFRAPPVALTALRAAGVDVATMANNHGADYGTAGLRDSLAASKAEHFPILGIGANKRRAFAPYRTTLNGVQVAIFAADQVQDETTLPLFSAGRHKAGVANAYDPALITRVRAAKKAGYVVVVYVHWGIELQTCPTSDQNSLAAALAHAGASAVIGTHAHVLQGAGWRGDGTYVAFGLGNYLWWRSFGNDQDDNGVLTLTFHRGRVTASHFAPSRLDDRGVPVRSTGAEKRRIKAEWNSDRQCTNLSAHPSS